MKTLLSVPTCFSVLVVLAFALASCGGDDTAGAGQEAQGCAINTDCNNPLVCAFKRCHDQCMSLRDCPVGQRCVQAKDVDTMTILGNVCQLPDEATKQCAVNSDCPGLQICGIDAKCRDQCAGDKDCPVVGQRCLNHTCADPEEVNDSGGLDQIIDGGTTRDGDPLTPPPDDDGGSTTTTTTGAGGSGSGSGGAGGGMPDGGSDVSVGGSDGGHDSSVADVSQDVSRDQGSGACGHQGEPCCTSGTACNLGYSCNGASMCVTCGGKGQPCCGTACTDANLDCIANTCQCGDSNQVCCGGTVCNSGLTCSMPDVGRPSCACGGNTQTCCPNMTCNGGSLRCAGLKCTCVTACFGDRYGGSNAYLMRTDGTISYYNSYYVTPLVVSDASAVPITGFTKVASSQSFACGIKSDKTVWCWAHPGSTATTDNYGELGDGTTNLSKAPVQVITTTLGGPNLVNAVDISTFGETTCAVTDSGTGAADDGSVWCWGYGAQGQLGNGTTPAPQYSAVAVQVVLSLGGSPLVNIDQISLGEYFACAHQRAAGAEGTAWCWGYNNYGQLGYDPATGGTSSVPRQVLQLLDGVSQVSASYYIGCARTGPDVWCWGYGGGVGLGDGPASVNKATPTPTRVLVADNGNPFTGVTDLRGSSAGPCALKSGDNSVWCWYGNSQAHPTPAAPAGFPVSAVSYWDNYGSQYLCFARTDGEVYFHSQKVQHPPACQ